MDLSRKRCVACEMLAGPLPGKRVLQLLRQVKGWRLDGKRRIRMRYAFKDFKTAMAFVNRVA